MSVEVVHMSIFFMSLSSKLFVQISMVKSHMNMYTNTDLDTDVYTDMEMDTVQKWTGTYPCTFPRIWTQTWIWTRTRIKPMFMSTLTSMSRNEFCHADFNEQLSKPIFNTVNRSVLSLELSYL